ncbi:YeeE/YedE thiosulfate transporter family protein [Glacieibacterium megasporae]|uniref:YeeE/YedE thiosulfate transporter family protein n=1 Tax=Glacieibacterium megasporae TaxID=2835787 RepID=UPI001C1E59B9|nr:YeeE/YedE thiosulfate transporter family protein [Polymorphobacter megasporae]UAJ11000.1 YeeE/YedE family protein [Polymorphobacter megasporae]
MLASIVLLVFMAGYVAQRGNICAVTAIDELVRHRRPHLFVGFLVCAACSLVAISIGTLAGYDVITCEFGLPATIRPALGGVIYGVGAFVNGRCAFGTAARLGSGELPRLATIGGFLIGAASVTYPTTPPPVTSVLLGLPHATRVLVAFTVTLALLWCLLSLPRASVKSRWRPASAMVAFGLIVGSLAVLAHGWAYTPFFSGVSPNDATFRRHCVFAFALLAGTTVGAIRAGLFAFRLGPLDLWARTAVGGGIMGVGARLVPGGNDAMLLVGLPLLLPNLVLAYTTMNATLIALALGGRSILTRSARRYTS